MKPLDQKLKYQIDKLLRVAVLGEKAGSSLVSVSSLLFGNNPSTDDTSKFKPNIKALTAPVASNACKSFRFVLLSF